MELIFSHCRGYQNPISYEKKKLFHKVKVQFDGDIIVMSFRNE
jgi:hypothetical protein